MPQLSSKHLIFIISALAIVSIKTYPTIFTKLSGRDTWIALIIASFFIFLYLIYILWICKKKNCFDFGLIYERALGKFFGNLFLILFLLTIFLTTVESSSVEASAMHNGFLFQTKTWQLLLLSVPVAIYIVHSGYDAVLNTVLIGIFFIAISGMVLFLLTKNYKDYSQLSPILEHGFNLQFFNSVIKLIGAYSSIAIFLPLLKYVRDIKNISKFSLFGFLFVTQLQVVSMLGTLATFEIDILNSMCYPKLVQTQLIRQANFLDAGQLFVMLQIVGGWIIKLTLTLYVITKILERFKLNKPLHLYILGIVIYSSACFASSNIFILFNLLNSFVYIEFVNFIVLPLMIFTIFLFRGNNKVS